MEEIKAQLLEFLGKVFVKDVLDTHEYFKDKMLEKLGVPFDLLSESPEVVQITANKDLVRKAVYVCKNCYLDKDLAVRPWVKPEANTLILRDMSSEIPQEQIEAIFNPNSEENKGNAEMKNCPPVASLRADDLNCWFITFLSEVDCKTALMCLRNVQFEGKRLSVRLKTTANKPIYTGFALGGGAGGSPTAGYSAGSPPVGYGAFNSPTLPPPGQGQEGLGGWENSNSGGKFKISMSLCLYISMSLHLHISTSLYLHLYIYLYIYIYTYISNADDDMAMIFVTAGRSGLFRSI